MDKEELKRLKARVIELLRSTKIQDIDYFIEELERTDYFKAPASAKGHLCFEGGLMVHSLNVYDAAMLLKKSLMTVRPDIYEKVSDESIIVTSLLHDMCKADLYFKRRGAQVDFGQAEYGFNQTDLPVGHGEKSVIRLFQMGLDLTDAEICAIRWHMGAWSVNQADSEQQKDIKQAEKLYPLVTLLHMADTVAAKVYERPATTI